jgi:hypothetical protein
MPLAPYASVLDPEMMRVAQEAYDMARAEIRQVDGYVLELARNLLAKRIIEKIQKQDERDRSGSRPMRWRGSSRDGA